MHSHADDVVEITIELVRAIMRVGTFDPAHANHKRARFRLHRELARLAKVQSEIGYLPMASTVPDAPRTLYVDGTSPVRAELRRLVPEHLGGAFVLRLLEFLDERHIISLSFRPSITLEQFEQFLDLVATPVDGPAIDDALSAAGNDGVVVVTARDLPSADAPWPMLVGYARLVHDALQRLGTASLPPATGIRPRAVTDAVRPFVRQPDVLVAFLALAPLLGARVAEANGASPRALIDAMFLATPSFAVHLALTSLRRTSMPLEIDETSRGMLESAIARRLVRDDFSPERDRALRSLCDAGRITAERLPLDLQKRILAERWLVALRDGTELPPRVPASVIALAARLAVEGAAFGLARTAVEHLRARDAAAVATLYDAAFLEAIATRCPDDHAVRDEVALLVDDGGPVAVVQLAKSIATLAPAPGDTAARLLTRYGTRGASVARDVLSSTPIESPDAVLLLLAVLRAHLAPSDSALLVKLVNHVAPAVRRESLSLLVTVDRGISDAYVARGFGDTDASVRIRALTICSATGIGREQLLPRAMDMILHDAAKADADVVCAAIDVVAKAAAQGAMLTTEAEDAFCKLVEPVGVLGRMIGRAPIPTPVLEAGVAALVRFNTPRVTRTLDALEREKDPDVVRIARAARQTRSIRPPPMP